MLMRGQIIGKVHMWDHERMMKEEMGREVWGPCGSGRVSMERSGGPENRASVSRRGNDWRGKRMRGQIGGESEI
jgi:hypothetical protein